MGFEHAKVSVSNLVLLSKANCLGEVNCLTEILVALTVEWMVMLIASCHEGSLNHLGMRIR